ncbi:MAG: pyruvate formate lyase family protein [Treponema sp.]|jgi:formate C-acetyltransferase|nr:pyruvate formate lyase family protein [Treponema sp.]
MNLFDIHDIEKLDGLARNLFSEKKNSEKLRGWFFVRELVCEYYEQNPEQTFLPLKVARALRYATERLPLDISSCAIFAGTQADAFSESYALINPAFKVEEFSGYCDPVAVYNDLEPDEEITAERIGKQRVRDQETDYVRALKKLYQDYEIYTCEVSFFIEQVTGHMIPDFRDVLKIGVDMVMKDISMKAAAEKDPEKQNFFQAMITALECVLILASRYREIAEKKSRETTGDDSRRFALMAQTLAEVPKKGAKNLFEAIQGFILLWQVMCLEQTPNPYAFSVGNADRIFEPYRAAENLDREKTAALFRHFLVFFNIGSRSWAISQNILVSGKNIDGRDLTNPTSYALLDAYYAMNLPQPILSVKLHQNTPEVFYEELGKFFFTPGCLTPSFFNDDTLFKILSSRGVEKEDLADYSVAGCQEPIIMGKENGNTTNSWLNLGKILELSLNNGVSLITGRRILQEEKGKSPYERLEELRKTFYRNAELCIGQMTAAANEASKAVAFLPVPFLSAFMGGRETGYDMRDIVHQGSRYNASGCLIHGLSVVADSFIAVNTLMRERPSDAGRLLQALKLNFEGEEELRVFLLGCPKFGNNVNTPDEQAVEIVQKISGMVKSKRNYLGNPFRADWSTPTTHLLYGYWVGATPDGRKAREMLNYGVDPLFGDASSGLGFRVLSGMKLPYLEMDGGYASHFGINPRYFSAPDNNDKGRQFRDRIITPLFFNSANKKPSPYYLYVNVTTPEILRKVLANPKKYAPSGVYIMRIHGTFVNFLDLSPAIQEDIICRLDPASSAMR